MLVTQHEEVFTRIYQEDKIICTVFLGSECWGYSGYVAQHNFLVPYSSFDEQYYLY